MQLIKNLQLSLFYQKKWRGVYQSKAPETGAYTEQDLTKKEGEKTKTETITALTKAGAELLKQTKENNFNIEAWFDKDNNYIAKGTLKDFLESADKQVAKEKDRISATLKKINEKASGYDTETFVSFQKAIDAFKTTVTDFKNELSKKIDAAKDKFNDRKETIKQDVNNKLSVLDETARPPEIQKQEKSLEETILDKQNSEKIKNLADTLKPADFKGNPNMWNKTIQDLFPQAKNIQEVQGTIGTKRDGHFGPHSVLSLLQFSGTDEKTISDYKKQINGDYLNKFEIYSNEEYGIKNAVAPEVSQTNDKEKKENDTDKASFKALELARKNFPQDKDFSTGSILKQGDNFIFTIGFPKENPTTTFKAYKNIESSDNSFSICETISNDNLRFKSYIGKFEGDKVADALKQLQARTKTPETAKEIPLPELTSSFADGKLNIGEKNDTDKKTELTVDKNTASVLAISNTSNITITKNDKTYQITFSKGKAATFNYDTKKGIENLTGKISDGNKNYLLQTSKEQNDIKLEARLIEQKAEDLLKQIPTEKVWTKIDDIGEKDFQYAKEANQNDKFYAKNEKDNNNKQYRVCEKINNQWLWKNIIDEQGLPESLKPKAA